MCLRDQIFFHTIQSLEVQYLSFKSTASVKKKARQLIPKYYLRQTIWRKTTDPSSLSLPWVGLKTWNLSWGWHLIHGSGIIKIWEAPLLPFGAWMSSELLWHFTYICFLDYKTCGKLTFWPTGKAHWGFKMERVNFFSLSFSREFHWVVRSVRMFALSLAATPLHLLDLEYTTLQLTLHEHVD